MDLFSSILGGLLVFIILLGPLMFIHELGHFIAAKRAGVRVEEFGMGFPPRALTLFKRDETVYSLNWLPIGAFVRMTGEEDPSDPRSFAAASRGWRLVILAAGPFMNFLGGFLILATAYLVFATQPTEFRYRISSVNTGSPAQAIGFQPGDVILSVNGMDMTQRIDPATHTTPQANALRQQTQAAIGKSFTAVVSRPFDDPNGGKPEYRTVTLEGSLPPDANPNAPLGVSLSFQVTKSQPMVYSVPEAISMAAEDVANVFVNLVRLPMEIMSQRIPLEQARPVSVVGITSIGVTLIEDRTTRGLFPFVQFAGYLSILLGLTNLLPIPALDGGRILFIVIEIVRGRRVDPQREQWVHAVGMMILLGLSAVIIVLDIIKPIVIR